MVDCLERYEWSSYSAYIDKVKSPPWLMRDAVYAQLTGSEHKAEQYQRFICNEDLDKKLINFYSQSFVSPILGNDLFIDSLALVKPSTEVPRYSQVYKRPSISAVISEVALMFDEEIHTLITMKKGRVKSNTPRKMAMYIARKYGDYRLQELADAFGLRHYGGVCYAIHAFAQELQKDQELERDVYNVVNRLGYNISHQ